MIKNSTRARIGRNQRLASSVEKREEERKVERSGKTEKRQVMDIGEPKVRPKASSYMVVGSFVMSA